jgi:hypothetical protein
MRRYAGAHNCGRQRTQLAFQVLATTALAGTSLRDYICLPPPRKVRTGRSLSPVVTLVRHSEKQPDPRARLARGAGAVLHHAVEAQQRGMDDRDAVRRSLRSLCSLARTQGILVEHLILICKDSWRTLPEASGLSPDVGRDVLKRVIAQCIDEYYRTDGHDQARRDPTASTSRVPETSLSFMLGPLS